ncbi:MAG: AbrB family transcriptional regulator [Arenicellales bacterium]
MAMPELVISFSMVVLGVLLGVEISYKGDVKPLKVMTASVVYTLFAMGLATLIAGIASRITGGAFLLYLLVLAPGGIAEISLISLALGFDVGLVAMAHACRFLLIMVIGPIGLRYYSRQKT